MSQEFFVYVGTYTRRVGQVAGQSQGIYIYRFDADTGEMSFMAEVPGVDNPSYLALHPQRPLLYAVNEVDDFEGQSSGAISAFAIDPASGHLTFLNQQPTRGAPCYVSIDQSGQVALVSNYSGGSVAAFRIGADGQLSPATAFIQHQGSSINPRRQQEAHAHSFTIDPTNRYAFAADLGIDKVMIYRLDPDQGRLTPHDPPSAAVKAGAGPRHMAFHPNGRLAYVVNELDSTVTAFRYDDAQGSLETVQTVSTLPADFEEHSTCADIHITPSGRFLYGSNRGHDSLAIFEIDPDSGRLTLVGYESTRGQTPRNFVLEPGGTFLLAANQNSDNIVIFRIDPETGRLRPTGQEVQVPMPVCIKMRPVA